MAELEGIAGWDARFGELVGRLAPRFGRRDLRRRAEGYLRGLMGRVERHTELTGPPHRVDQRDRPV
ncbi:MAG: hypothetical protein K2X91_13770, partial [Thermoleophilia bacterium]|nr:hypothetical protein [Thermoleophilia bacterium]